MLNKICRFIKKEKISLKYIINTHNHFDHINGNKFLKKKTPAQVISYNSGLRDGDYVEIGNIKLKIIETPGHTADGVSLFVDKNLFTGDTLFVGDSGATVSKDSDRTKLGESLRKLITVCPRETIIWSGHDLGDKKVSTLEYEQKNNINSEEYKLKTVHYKF